MGSAKSKQNRKPVKRQQDDLPEHIYELLVKSLHSLPFPEGAITDEMVQKTASYAQFVDIFDSTELLKKGKKYLKV